MTALSVPGRFRAAPAISASAYPDGPGCIAAGWLHARSPHQSAAW
ncbi:hypothetical protein LHGZ1_2092 [Laribacter hongkongensis]|uniref:Uncharacterized protein n=1 Tax=Laribacter hongkongensis TaxID=168471 RepID=A0A248LL81_9NEIS|nr:hypothetical protein LHGZ1_2092 [Laribacter hongkongensis]